MQSIVIPNLDATHYVRHALHSDAAAWSEKNCYVDLWIELLHTLKLEPRAMLPFTVAVDFEGDQWTFYKPSHHELFELYGIDVQEMNVWRPLLDHAVEHLPAGKLISVEADAHWLPDTAGTDYRTAHTKTTIVLNELDTDAQRLGYFHNAGYYELSGEDFIRTFRIDAAPDPTYLPLFAELVRVDRMVRRPDTDLAALSAQLWHKYLDRVPTANPITKFRDRFATDIGVMQERGLAHYHAWAFATTRQLGSAFELAAANLRWLAEQGYQELDIPIQSFEEISGESKAFILKGARAVNSKRPLDMAATFDRMIAAWNVALPILKKNAFTQLK